jgi:hypothetical protein
MKGKPAAAFPSSGARHVRSFDDLLGRVRSEFIEMPGLWLTTAQAVRLWGIERAQCEEVLQALVTENFLVLRGDGKFGRPTEG